MRLRAWVGVLGAGVTLSVLAGCASAPPYNSAFSARKAVNGNSEQVAGGESEVFRAVLATFTKHGFTVQSAHLRDGLISAVGDIQDPHESDVTYTITTTVTVSPLGPDQSNVALAASEKKVVHQKTRTYFHLLWILPIFPTGTQYHTVDRGSGIIRDPKFYKQFFQEVNASLKTIQTPPVVLHPIAAAPAIQVEALTPIVAPAGADAAVATAAPTGTAAVPPAASPVTPAQTSVMPGPSIGVPATADTVAGANGTAQ